ncbi:MAG: Asp/Glu racemase [Kiloniellales bacterium]|nr:Asp/Glu racemase [Kiloniellales bacterium]
MKLAFDSDQGFGRRAALGLIVLQADETIEPEFRSLVDLEGVVLYHSRVPSGAEVTPESLAAMQAEIPAAVRLLPPTARFDVIGYACTSGATIIGEAAVAAAIRSVRPGVSTSDPLTATKAACRALGVRRLGFVTPYVAEVSLAMRRNLEEAGLEIAAFGSFEESEEAVVARIAPASVLDAIVRVGAGADCEAVFASCTNLRATGVIAEAEVRLGKPVITSNQALAWHMLRLAGLSESQPAGGSLFRCELP